MNYAEAWQPLKAKGKISYFEDKLIKARQATTIHWNMRNVLRQLKVWKARAAQ